jgi:hypothetical protein
MLAELSPKDQASLDLIRDAVTGVRGRDADVVRRGLEQGDLNFNRENEPWKNELLMRKRYGRYMEREVARQVMHDPNIKRLGRPFKKEADFQLGEGGFNIDITSNTKYSRDLHLKRPYIDGEENLVTYEKPALGFLKNIFGL